jgi:hypothetical protein
MNWMRFDKLRGGREGERERVKKIERQRKRETERRHSPNHGHDRDLELLFDLLCTNKVKDRSRSVAHLHGGERFLGALCACDAGCFFTIKSDHHTNHMSLTLLEKIHRLSNGCPSGDNIVNDQDSLALNVPSNDRPSLSR